MSTSTPTSSSVSSALLDVVRDEFGRIAYSHKAHQKMVDRLNWAVLWEKRLNAALIALTAGNTVAVVLTDARLVELTAILLSALALLLTIYGLSRNRERLVDQHRQAALGLWLLREKYVHLIGDLRTGAVAEDEGRRKRDELMQQAAQIYASAPDTDTKAYAAAQKALKRDEELTFSQQEIDVMLPAALRSAPLPPAQAPTSRVPGSS